jgi:hypothetical protein
VDYTGDLDAVLPWAIKNDVVAHGKTAEIGGKLWSFFTDQWLGGKQQELPVE